MMSFMDTMWYVAVNYWAVIALIAAGLSAIVFALIIAARHEIHSRSFACMKCGHQWYMTIATLATLERRGDKPRCGVCGSDNVVSVIQ